MGVPTTLKARDKLALCFASIFISLSTEARAASEALTLRFSGLRSDKGFLAISVFSEQESSSFPDKSEQATRTYYLSIGPSLVVEQKIEGLQDGFYSVSVMHDEDGDRKFRTGLFGIPREGFGFSNNPTIYFGPPAFSKTRFKLPETNVSEIQMKYF